MEEEYIDILIQNNWIFEENNEIIDRNTANFFAENKLGKISDGLFSFISKYSLLTNQSDDVWFIPIKEYSISELNEDEFSWNDFQLESLEYADTDDEKQIIKNFWDKHLPFLFSVKNGYAYIAQILSGENKGKIVYGREPEYDDVEIISNSFEDFVRLHSAIIKNKKEVRVLTDFK